MPRKREVPPREAAPSKRKEPEGSLHTALQASYKKAKVDEGSRLMQDSDKRLTKEAIAELSFEEALVRLEGAVAALEQGSLPLEEAVHVFEEGNLLRQHCEKKLSEAKLKIEKVIQATQEGEVTLEPVERS